MTRRDELLEAAVQLLAARGEAALTLEAVAKAAGTSKGLVLYHFVTKRRLLAEVADALLEETRAGLERLAADYPEPDRRLEALVEALFEEPPEMDRGGVRNVLAFWLEGGRHARRAELLSAFVVKAVAEGARAGAYRRVRDPERVAGSLLTHWTGALALWASGHEVDFEAERAFVERALLRPLEEAPGSRRGRRR